MSSLVRWRHLHRAALLALLLPATAVSYTTTPLPSGGFYGDMAVDNTHRQVFISKGDSITVTDFDGHLVTTITGEPGAAGMALDRLDRLLYVALGSADAIAQIDTQTFAEIARRPLGLGGACPGMITIARHLIWFGFTCEINCNCPPFVPAGIGSLDFRRGRVKLFSSQGSLPVPIYHPVVKSTPRLRNVLLAGDLTYGALIKYRLPRDGKPQLEMHQYGGDNLQDFAITPDGAHVIAAAGGIYHLSSFRMADLAPDAEYPTGPYPEAVAITSDSAYVAGGLSPSYVPDIQIYPTNMTVPVATYDLAPYWLQSHGIAFDRAGDRLFAVTTDYYFRTFTLLTIQDPLSPPPTTTSTTSTTTTSTTGTTSTTVPACTFLTTWGSTGSGDGQFSGPAGVATDAAGNVYVTDFYNNRIEKFDATGTFLSTWGSGGSANGQFINPYGIAIDTSGNVYVTDTRNNRVQKFDATGTFLGTWGSFGSGDGQFNTPAGVATDASGNVYVGDAYNNRVQKFDMSGTFLTTWGSYGSGSGLFNFPTGVATDGSGAVYVADTDNNRVQKFDPNGTFLTAWGGISSPFGVATDASGHVYVSDYYAGRIDQFDANGSFLGAWGSYGSGDGQFINPRGLATDASGDVYVADHGNNRIQKFACPTGSGSTTTTTSASTTTTIVGDCSIVIDRGSGGIVYVDCPTTQTSTSAGITTTTAPSPVCCSDNRGACIYEPSAADCINFNGTPGAAGTVCDCMTGACGSPPASAGNCCDDLAGVGCICGEEANASNCSSAGALFIGSNSVCSPSGTCGP